MVFMYNEDASLGFKQDQAAVARKKKLIKGELQHHLIIYSSLIEQFLVIFLKHFSFTEEVGSKFIPETDVLIMCSLMFQTE